MFGEETIAMWRKHCLLDSNSFKWPKNMNRGVNANDKKPF